MHRDIHFLMSFFRERRNCLLGVPALQNRNFLPQPGLVYSADEQCQSSYGNRSRVCRVSSNHLGHCCFMKLTGYTLLKHNLSHKLNWCKLISWFNFFLQNYHHGDWNTLCYGLACLVPKQSECHVIFPHDGTPCGYQKVQIVIFIN